MKAKNTQLIRAIAGEIFCPGILARPKNIYAKQTYFGARIE